jgi:hypothetical protein
MNFSSIVRTPNEERHPFELLRAIASEQVPGCELKTAPPGQIHIPNQTH